MDIKEELARIDAARREQGLSLEQLAEAVGRTHSSISKLLSGQRKPDIEHILRLKKHLGLDDSPPATLREAPRGWQAVDDPKDVAVFGASLAGTLDDHPSVECLELQFDAPVNHVDRPTAISRRRGIYALYIASEALSPRLEPGDLIYVDPATPPRAGDIVVVHLAGGDTTYPAALIHALVRRTAHSMVLGQIKPALEFEIPADRIAAAHRVIPWRELLAR